MAAGAARADVLHFAFTDGKDDTASLDFSSATPTPFDVTTDAAAIDVSNGTETIVGFVPETASLSLLGSGALVMVALRRRNADRKTGRTAQRPRLILGTIPAFKPPEHEFTV